MRKIVGFVVAVGILFTACEKEVVQEDLILKKASKFDVCHYDEDADSWHVINISEKALKAHLAHGDVVLDADGDSYYPENECGINPDGLPWDCDDNDVSVQVCQPEVQSGYIENVTILAGAKWRNFLTGGNGWELAVGDPSSFATNAATSHKLDFTYSGNYFFSPETNTIEYSYTQNTGEQKIMATVLGGIKSGIQNNGDLGTINYLEITIVGRKDQEVKLMDVVLSVGDVDYPLGNFTALNQWNTWHLEGIDLTSGLSIKAKLELVGQAFSEEHSKVMISVGKM